MTCKELPGAGMGPTPDNMNKCCLHTELSSHEGTRSEFSPGKAAIKLGIDVHQEFYVVVCQEGGAIRSRRSVSKKKRFFIGGAKLKEKSGAEQLAAQLSEVELVFERKVGENDHLFGSVTSGDIAH